jgi:hypothetical protein
LSRCGFLSSTRRSARSGYGIGQFGFGLDLNNRRALASIMEADARRLFLNDAGRNGHDGIFGRMLLIQRVAARPLAP